MIWASPDETVLPNEVIEEEKSRRRELAELFRTRGYLTGIELFPPDRELIVYRDSSRPGAPITVGVVKKEDLLCLNNWFYPEKTEL